MSEFASVDKLALSETDIRARRILVAKSCGGASVVTGAVVVEEGGVDEGVDEGAFASAIANTGFARVRGRPTVFRRRDDDGTSDTCGTRRCAQHKDAVDDDSDNAEENAGSVEACMMEGTTVDT